MKFVARSRPEAAFTPRRPGTCRRRGTVWTASLLALSSLMLSTTGQLAPNVEIDIELEQAPLVETLQSFASISGSRLDITPGIEGLVTLSLKKTPWRDVLDRICGDHQLHCELEAGEPPVLRVRPEAEAASAEGVAVPSSDDRLLLTPRDQSPAYPPAGADRLLGVRFQPPGSSKPIEGVARFNWTTPIRAFTSAAESHSGDTEAPPRWQVRLSWIPFSPDLDLVVPIMIRCTEQAFESKLLTPVRWPLDQIVERRWQGALIALSSPITDAGQTQGQALDLDCTEDVTETAIRATVRGSDAQGNAREAELALDSRPGTYLLVAPPGAQGRSAPAAAVLAVGPDAEGELQVAILRPDATGGVEIGRQILRADRETYEQIASPDGLELDLRLQLAD